MVLGNMVRDYASINWKDTKAAVKYFNAKQVYYFSIEFLLGKMLTSNLKNLGIYDMVVEGLKDLDINYEEIAKLELDPGLGKKWESLLVSRLCFSLRVCSFFPTALEQDYRS